MSRLDDITEAAIDTFGVKLPPGFNSVNFLEDLKDLRTAFALGAQWADNHPFIENVIRAEDWVDPDSLEYFEDIDND